MPNPSIAPFIVFEITAFIRTDGHGLIDSTSDPDKEHIYFMGSETLPPHILYGVGNASFPNKYNLYFMESETLPSSCYIFSDESSVPFNSTSNGYKKSFTLRVTGIKTPYIQEKFLLYE